MARHYTLIMLFSAILSIGYSLSQDKNVSVDNDIPANHWAVLIAGSNTYKNYRHQADLCHAYQILRGNGVPKEHIITLSYNDAVNHRYNPFKGQLFNKPTGDRPGVDVYEGCEIDYSGEAVTVKNVQGVLTGDKSLASGKVLESTENDYVFINFHAMVANVSFRVCLGDLFSVNWMENEDFLSATGYNETLEQQYDLVKKETTFRNGKFKLIGSDYAPGSEATVEHVFGEFFGRPKPQGMTVEEEVAREKERLRAIKQVSSVPSRMIPIHMKYSELREEEGKPSNYRRQLEVAKELLQTVEESIREIEEMMDRNEHLRLERDLAHS
ncbi:conserved hypothetical protein [Perkinsus marinus ATCC 50983]|uniref:Legumain n=1 Tax=Perkinsus marinus (strain ATCC 50983 / TXsc) TaxID=423536 RepID=C5KMY4_PERM5|nr:conserved hypothetical protein [Perkinsus marinus ATCC 50983]EER14292.1 conserved hypothetical protein [Perkinsus marinus ATCC 50983]|eukprot:XP_002782497.1 conserved hypothetical protein [Perkinsus marinus ATCC 50983]